MSDAVTHHLGDLEHDVERKIFAVFAGYLTCGSMPGWGRQHELKLGERWAET